MVYEAMYSASYTTVIMVMIKKMEIFWAIRKIWNSPGHPPPSRDATSLLEKILENNSTFWQNLLNFGQSFLASLIQR